MMDASNTDCISQLYSQDSQCFHKKHQPLWQSLLTDLTMIPAWTHQQEDSTLIIGYAAQNVLRYKN